MTDKETDRLYRLGYSKLRIPMLYLVNITYGIFINSKSDSSSTRLTVDNYNDFFNKLILVHTPNFMFYDKQTQKSYVMGLERVKIDKMIPRDNSNTFQQDNYDILGDIELDFWGEGMFDPNSFSWYKRERNRFNKLADTISPKAAAMNEAGELVPVELSVADNITTEDYCAFINIIQTLPIIEEFILFAMFRNSDYRCMDTTRETRYFSQAEVIWASMLTNDSISRIVDGFRIYDVERGTCRITTLKVCVNYHTRPLTGNEYRYLPIYIPYDNPVAIDKLREPSFKCLSVGVFTLSDNTI